MSIFLKKNDKAILPISLTTIGLFLITTVLLLALLTMFLQHPLNTKTALETITARLHQTIESVDLSIIEKQQTLLLDPYKYPFTLSLSSDSIISETQTTQQMRIIHQCHVNWWIHQKTTFWDNSSSFHHYLKSKYGFNGTITNPIPYNTTIIQQINALYNESSNKTLHTPYQLDIKLPIHIEKIMIYYRGKNLRQNSIQSFILIYQ